MRTTSFLFLLAVGSNFVFAQKSVTPDPVLVQIDSQIDSLSHIADSYPPDINPEDSTAVQAAVAFCDHIVDQLEALLKNESGNAGLHRRLGEVFRMGHNLNIKGAGQNAVEHLTTAIKLDPSDPDAYFSLGLFYVNANFEFAPEAEQMFRKALELSPEGSPSYAYQGLAFAYYYQGKMEESVMAWHIFLSLHPDSESAKNLLKIALGKLSH